jgi:hypothetical protein
MRDRLRLKLSEEEEDGSTNQAEQSQQDINDNSKEKKRKFSRMMKFISKLNKYFPEFIHKIIKFLQAEALLMA